MAKLLVLLFLLVATGSAMASFGMQSGFSLYGGLGLGGSRPIYTAASRPVYTAASSYPSGGYYYIRPATYYYYPSYRPGSTTTYVYGSRPAWGTSYAGYRRKPSYGFIGAGIGYGSQR